MKKRVCVLCERQEVSQSKAATPQTHSHHDLEHRFFVSFFFQKEEGRKKKRRQKRKRDKQEGRCLYDGCLSPGFKMRRERKEEKEGSQPVCMYKVVTTEQTQTTKQPIDHQPTNHRTSL